MTADELKTTLLSTAASLSAVANLLPPDTNDRLGGLLHQVADSPAAVQGLTLVLRAFNPAVSSTDVQHDLDCLAAQLVTLRRLETDGSLNRLEAVLRRVASRPLLLRALARMF